MGTEDIKPDVVVQPQQKLPPTSPVIFIRILNRIKRFLYRPYQNVVYAIIALPNRKILSDYFLVNEYGMIKSDSLKEEFDVYDPYHLFGYSVLFYASGCRQPLQLHEFSKAFELKRDDVTNKGITDDVLMSNILGANELMRLSKLAHTKMNNRTLDILFYSSNDVMSNKIILLAAAAGSILSAVILLGFINSPPLQGIQHSLGTIISLVKPAVVSVP